MGSPKGERDEVVIPVVKEELKTDAMPVETGGVRITKHVHSHDELVQQELRTGRVDVKRVTANRPVQGPLPVRRSGNTLIVPVVSEVVRVEREWVLTEEIYLTQHEDVKTVQQAVPVKEESVTAERLDGQGNIVQSIEPQSGMQHDASGSLLRARGTPRKSERTVSNTPSILRDRPRK